VTGKGRPGVISEVLAKGVAILFEEKKDQEEAQTKERN